MPMLNTLTACLEKEKKMREIWTREVAEKDFIYSFWSSRKIETTD